MKILVIRLGAMGDLLHVSPSLAVVKKMLPETEIDFLTTPLYADLIRRFTGVNRVFSWNKSWGSLFSLGKELSARHYDATINLHPSLKTMALTQLAGAKKQTVYQKEKLTLRGQDQRPLARRHAVRDFYEPFRTLLALPDDPPPLLPTLHLNPSPQKSPTPLVGLIPGVGGKRGNRAWFPEQYTALIKKTLGETPARFVLIGGPDEALLAHELAKIDPARIENTCGQGDILQTAHRLAQCHVVVGGDTGPLHLATAVGTPVIGLFGPTSLKRTGPVGPMRGETLLPQDDLPCWPCELPTCPLTGNDHLICMKQITPDSVFAALRRQLDS